MGATHEEIAALLEAFETSDWQEMTVELGGDRVHVSRRETSDAPTAPPAPAARPAAAPAPVPAPAAAPVRAADAGPAPTGTVVTSPSVGIFWRAPAPTDPPFVEVGQRVDAQDTVGIVEVMKLMQQVTAGTSGTVTAVVVNNGATVDYGQALVYIDPAGG
jgi:acetyl-CoA carboxylase biotin carboxyl carrier protein